MKIRVLLLDDHDVVRSGLAMLLAMEDDIEVVAQAGTATEALAAVEELSPNVAVLDVRLPESSGIEVCREIRSSHPDTQCLMLTSFADDDALVDAGLAGAAAFVLKQIRGSDLADTIRAVHEGRVLLNQATIRLALQRLRESTEYRVNELSPQETRIFELIGEGMANRQIADEMFLAEKTVKNYISTLFTKLGVTRRTEAAVIAARIDERERQRHQ
jgi:two-component system response regulator DevR